ncbi:MAG TPA: prephenate dehydrogenase/arogenate dehydrogenase family protein [Actinomycetota bacterium]|nr:prephenate dehydrogenase/arogenate dehydrogenase family protein [Actinomycetota bacterium]
MVPGSRPGSGARRRPRRGGAARETLAILGTGLMGGSLGLASLAEELVDRVTGWDADPDMAKRALARGAVTEVAGSVAEAVAGASLVVLSMPVSAIPASFRAVAPHLQPGAVVTDLGSTKGRVVEEINPLVPDGVHFIGGHPIAGSEKEGIEAADPDLFRGAFWILTPTTQTDPEAYGRLVHFLGGLAVHVLSLDPARHDELLALTSHLPQLLSSTLMGFAADIAAAEGGLPLAAGGGFRDMTRIAGSSPDLWLDIVRENRRAVLALLHRFQEALESTTAYIDHQDWEGLRAALAAAREGRARLPEKPGLEPASLMELLIPVPDRPGVIAEVTTTVGEAGVNIEGLTIVHSPEGGRGTMHLEVNGEAAARVAGEALERKGYLPHIVPGL